MMDPRLRADLGGYLDSALQSLRRLQRAGAEMQAIHIKAHPPGRRGRPPKCADAARCDDRAAGVIAGMVGVVTDWAASKWIDNPSGFAVATVAQLLNRSPKRIEAIATRARQSPD